MDTVKRKDVKRIYNLPGRVQFCKKCTISNQRPRIVFDEKSVCSACRFAEFKHNEIDWEAREKELLKLLAKYKRADGGYEVLVPASGGKDSGYVAHQLKYKYGMNVFTVTWAPHLYTDVGFKNFQDMMHVGGLDNLLGTPNGIVHRKLTKLAFEMLGDPFQPFIYGQTNFPLQVAVRYKIPLVMYGENGEVEYGGDMSNALRPNRDYREDHTKHYFSGIEPQEFSKHGIEACDLRSYMAPDADVMDDVGVQIHFFSYYQKWVPQENYYYCIEYTGFTPNSERSEGTYSKYASLDDKLDGIHYYLAYMKFGLGRATSDTAHEVRDRHITREEGVELVKKYDGEFPKKYFDVFLKYCDISESQFHTVIDSWRAPHLWERRDGKWQLKHAVFD